MTASKGQFLDTNGYSKEESWWSNIIWFKTKFILINYNYTKNIIEIPTFKKSSNNIAIFCINIIF